MKNLRLSFLYFLVGMVFTLFNTNLVFSQTSIDDILIEPNPSYQDEDILVNISGYVPSADIQIVNSEVVILDAEVTITMYFESVGNRYSDSGSLHP